MKDHKMDVAIIGAGIGGLAAAIRLAHAGRHVEIFETHAHAGGKMRSLPTHAGPVDAGPTVLTMRPVFERLFADVGENLTDHVTLLQQEKLARHFWASGETLDLYSDPDKNHEAIRATFGSTSAREFDRFNARTKSLFEALKTPMMFAPRPNHLATVQALVKTPSLLAKMAPHHSLSQSLAKQFSEPKLAQLFARYATYVGGSPNASPAVLSLIWQAEAGGVWQVKGGMQELANALIKLALDKNVVAHFNTKIDKIIANDDQIRSLITQDKTHHKTRAVLFNGDPTALLEGHLGQTMQEALPRTSANPRSHSANVWSFCAKPAGQELSLHNIFFPADSTLEFKELAAGNAPSDPTLYVYAQDRGGTEPPNGAERFEIIINAPPTSATTPSKEEIEQCKTLTVSALERMGLTFSNAPETLTTPAQFNQLFPASRGALYGRSPHGLMAAFKRPTARTKIKGLYLAGGGCHPGAGIPMATLSGMHAAEAILNDQTSTSTSRRTAMRGGMSMASQTMAKKPSQSSAS